jgi:hypothetical protein
MILFYRMSLRGAFAATKQSPRWLEIASSREEHPALAMTFIKFEIAQTRDLK